MGENKNQVTYTKSGAHLKEPVAIIEKKASTVQVQPVVKTNSNGNATAGKSPKEIEKKPSKKEVKLKQKLEAKIGEIKELNEKLAKKIEKSESTLLSANEIEISLVGLIKEGASKKEKNKLIRKLGKLADSRKTSIRKSKSLEKKLLKSTKKMEKTRKDLAGFL